MEITEAVPILLVCWFLESVLRRLGFSGELLTLELRSLDANWLFYGLLLISMQIRLLISNNLCSLAYQVLEVLFANAACIVQASMNIKAALLAVAGRLASAALVTAISLSILGLVAKAGLLGELRLGLVASETFQVAELTLDVLCSLIIIATVAWCRSSNMRSSLLESYRWVPWMISWLSC